MKQTLFIAMLALPVVFMLHEFEEIIMFKRWLNANKSELQKRFPKIYLFMNQKGFFEFSTEQFATAVLFEFILLSSICFASVFYGVLSGWLVVFMAYFLHLFVHIAQWIAYHKYVPTIITTILTLPYCIYIINLLIKNQLFSVTEWILSIFIGFVLMICIVPLAHFFSRKIKNVINRHNS